MQYYFVLFEGIDGSGKTTIAKRIAEKMGAFYYSSPPQDIRVLRSWADSNNSQHTRLAYYLMGNAFSSWEIANHLVDKSVICDRYLLSTIAYYRSIGLQINMLEVRTLLNLLMPHITFLLDVSDERVRQERLSIRGVSENDAKNSNVLEPLRKEFTALDWPNLHTIDTSYYTIDEVEALVSKKIASIK